MDTILEILKYILPSLVVLACAYLVLKMLLEDRKHANSNIIRAETIKLTLPLRLSAYERLTLLCDRVALQNVLLRVRMPGMSVAELRAALMLTINQEFEHNTSQQLYVSDTLWQIISLAKADTLTAISIAATDLDPKADGDLLVEALMKVLDSQSTGTSLQKASIAIRTEAGQLF